MAAPEGFRKVVAERGTEGALFVLADALEALSRRLDAQDAVEDKLRGEAQPDESKQQATPPPPPQEQNVTPGRPGEVQRG